MCLESRQLILAKKEKSSVVSVDTSLALSVNALLIPVWTTNGWSGENIMNVPDARSRPSKRLY